MVLAGLVACYSIFNAGNPNNILRPIFPDPAYDVYVALGSSVLVFVLGFVVFYIRDMEGFKNLIEMNAGRIRELRRKGYSDEAIADSILAAMGASSGGYRYRMTRKKLIVYLAQFR